MDQDEEILDENSIEDLSDQEDTLNPDIGEAEKIFNLTESPDKEETDEEEILQAETEFGEDPEYDDSIDDYDTDQDEYTL